MRRPSLVSTAMAMGILCLTGRDAHAFCRTTTNEDFVPTLSEPCDTIGVPLQWPSKCVGYSLQRDASIQVDLATEHAIVGRAFDDWSAVDCATCGGMGVGNPSITFVEQATVACNRSEYNQASGNANIIVFHDSGWPHPDADITLALTTVTFDIESGAIYDADIELNSDPSINTFTVDDAKIAYDVPSIFAHEVGHFLGLAHTQTANTDATMSGRYKPGATFMRSPAGDRRVRHVHRLSAGSHRRLRAHTAPRILRCVRQRFSRWRTRCRKRRSAQGVDRLRRLWVWSAARDTLRHCEVGFAVAPGDHGARNAPQENPARTAPCTHTHVTIV